ncbi:hypothetical protein FO519_005814 [Halicephalobus sp. NKZ332]|nr:hypothetical protein FO519_005814 [Halicephalobus sp. NKZ332]
MASNWDYRNPWDPRNYQPSPRPYSNNFEQYFWNSVQYGSTIIQEEGILDYVHQDFMKCLKQDFCVFPLVLSGVAFSFISTFIITIGVLYFVGVVYGLMSKIYCIFYQMAYFVSENRWKVEESKLDQLRKEIIFNRDVANQRFRSLDEDKIQINKLLKTFGL